MIFKVEKQKIAILGSNGFLASSFQFYYKDRMIVNVYGRSKPKSGCFDNFIKFDCINDEIPLSLLDNDLIVNCIGAGVQSQEEISEEKYFSINVLWGIKLNTFLVKNNFARKGGAVFTFGSYFEAGNLNLTYRFDESSFYDVSNTLAIPYALSKRLFTTYYNLNNLRKSSYHFILPNVYGERENTKHLIPYAINGISKGETIQFTSGSQLRQYLNIDDLMKILENVYLNRNTIPCDIYNIGYGEVLTVKDIIAKIYKAFDKEIPKNAFSNEDRRDSAIGYLAMNNDKIDKYIHFSCSIDINCYVKNYVKRLKFLEAI